MDNSDKKFIKELFNDMKKLNIEEKFLMFKYYIEAYTKSVFTFGINHEVTLDAKEIWNSYLLILKEESILFNFIKTNLNKMELNTAINYINYLDDINTKTITYFYEALDDILDACESKDEFRAKHKKKDFETLIETDKYREEIVGLTINLEDICNFLNLSEENRIKVVNYIDANEVKDLTSVLQTIEKISALMNMDDNLLNLQEQFKKVYLKNSIK